MSNPIAKRQSPATPKVVPSPPKKPQGQTTGLTHPPGFHGKSAISVVLYGGSGVGKTSFAAYFPDPFFLIDPKEKGILDLVEFKQCPAPIGTAIAYSHTDALAEIEKVYEGRTKCRTLVIDSMTGFELMAQQHNADLNYDGKMEPEGFFSYQKGPKATAKTEWASEFLNALERCVDNQINVVVIGHSRVKTFKNPSGPDYERAMPYVDDETWQQTHRWAKCVLYYDIHVDVVKPKGESRKKANPDSERRIIYTDHGTTYIAKNRWGLPPLINADGGAEDAYQQFVAAFKDAANR